MASYDYNEIQPGASDIDREAWPVMYDPQDNSGCLYKVVSINSTTIKIDGYGTEQDPLKASVIGGSLDGKVSINITNKEDSAVVLSGLGTSVNPLKADVNPEKLDGRVKIMVSSGSELCWLVGDGTEENPLDVEVNIPADFITNIEDTDTIELQVNDSILTANVILNEEQGNVILETSGGLRAEIDLSEYMKTVETRDTDSVVFGGNGWPESPLTASVVSSALDGQVKVEVSDSEGVGLVGDGTENNPVVAVVHYSDFDGKVGIATANTGNVVLEGRGTSGDPLTASVVIPEDYITSTESTDTISLAVDANGVLTAEAIISSAEDNQLVDLDGLYVPEPESLYLGAFPSSDRPTSAQTGQYILDTDLGYVIFRDGDAWVNAAGGIEEGELPASSGYIDYVQNPMTGTGDLIVGGSDGYPERLAPGTDGQLMSIVNGEPTWINRNRHSVENYCIVNSNTKFELAGYTQKMYTNLVIPSTSGTYTKLGFFHLSGTVGYVILGMYDASGNLVCQTPMTEPTSATEGNVCWIDTIAPFTLDAGEVYQMAFYAIENGYNNLINTFMLEKDTSELFSNFIAGESLRITLSELPATKPTVFMSTFVPWMGAKE